MTATVPIGDRSARRRSGWTRTELAVVVAILVMASGLLIVTVQYGRNQAHVVECEMHLKSMGEAIREFEVKHKTLPASCIAPGYATWAVQIAPLLLQDRGKALAGWNEGLPYFQQPEEVRKGQVWVYLCPGRRDPPQYSVSGDVPAMPPGQSNYSGALGDYGCAPESSRGKDIWTTPDADGSLIVGDVLERQGDKLTKWQSRTTLNSLKRGQQYTILLGEKQVPAGSFGQADAGDGSLYNGAMPANFSRLIDDERPLGTGPTAKYQTNFGSWHPGVCLFLLADVSVRKFANDTPAEVIQKLIPRGTSN
jgi:hypothetical protein